jgi:hypothetical protein
MRLVPPGRAPLFVTEPGGLGMQPVAPTPSPVFGILPAKHALQPVAFESD